MSDNKKNLFASVRRSAVINNPVLFESIGIAPVVAMAVSLKSAIILSVVSAVELILIELIACLLLKKLKSSLRMVIYAILGIAVNIPMYLFFNSFAPNEVANAGIFLPLLAVNSLIALHCERFAVRHKISETLVDAVSAGASYAFVILVVGILRETLGKGTVYSTSLNLPIQLSGMLMPFGGFLLLGFMAAALQAVVRKKYPDENPEKSFDMSEISQSHLATFKTLMEEDFNPYGDSDDAPARPAKMPKPKASPKKEPKVKKKEPKPAAKKSKAARNNKAQTASDTNAVRLSDRSRENYLSDFDDILSELDQYKKQQSTVDKTDAENGNGGEEK